MMLEVVALVRVAMSILNFLASETVSCSHQAQKLKDPVSSICQLLLATERKLDCNNDNKEDSNNNDDNNGDSNKNNNNDDDDEDNNNIEGIMGWVEKVSKTLYEASDLVDEAASVLVSKVRCSPLLFGIFRCSNSSSSICGERLGPKINRLCNQLTQLTQAGSDAIGSSLGLQEEPVTLMGEPPSRMIRSSGVEFTMGGIIGREVEKEATVDMLLDTSDLSDHISAVAIVGVGGVGKTTLARLVFDDERITNHFDLKMWVSVSRNDILESIHLSCSTGSSKIGELVPERLIHLLRGKITGKIFLLVLDDVWDVNSTTWLHLLTLLQVGARGSKILVTTRSPQVAWVSQCRILYLNVLDEDNSWQLFRRIAFGQQEPPENLRAIGMKIIKKCWGFPLVIAAAASSVRGQSVEEWMNTLSMAARWQPDFTNILLHCYNNLPTPLKACFAYCSLFPQSCKISTIDLVGLWMAQGYIEPQDSLDPEDIAMEYFLMLSERYFFTDPAMDEFGNIETCRMHDLYYDLATSLSTKAHLSVHHNEDRNLLRDKWLKDNEGKIRTFVCWTAPEDDSDDKEMVRIFNDIPAMPNFSSLRVLVFHAFGLQVLPDSICNLIHIRYLDLSHNESLLQLPGKFSHLYHLQTLKLNFCLKLKELPTSFGKLVCLRRLEINGCENLTFMPPGFGNLSSLRTLPRYVVGRPRLQSASGFEELRNLNHLRGRLMIELSENWATAAKNALKSNLSNKTRLQELEIKWGPTRLLSKTDVLQHQLLLNGLQPPLSLKMLQIEGYRGKDFPSWAKGNSLSTAVPNLVTVCIDGCGKCKTLPSFSHLPNLRSLSLRFMEKVQFFENSDNLSSTSTPPFFPSLQELTLHSFYSLEGWWKDESQVQPFSCLRTLKLWSCPKLTSMPLFPKVEVLDMQNVNEKLLGFLSGCMTRSELHTSTQPSSSHSKITDVESRERPQNFPRLKTLHIKSCPRLDTLAVLKSSKNLKKLVVERLDMLSSLAEDLKQLTSLEELEVAGCKDLELSSGCQDRCGGCDKCNVPWIFFAKLRHLTLRELPKLEVLPDGLQCVKTLNVLCISTCSKLRELPESVMSNLTSLRHLRLEGCPELKMLPEGLKNIRSLIKVDIIECPQLMERCRSGGEDWHKIKHARVLCHKSWRYALMSEAESLQKPKEKGKTVVVHSEDLTIHVIGDHTTLVVTNSPQGDKAAAASADAAVTC